jgi:hypothetical protein
MVEVTTSAGDPLDDPVVTLELGGLQRLAFDRRVLELQVLRDREEVLDVSLAGAGDHRRSHEPLLGEVTVAHELDDLLVLSAGVDQDSS